MSLTFKFEVQPTNPKVGLGNSSSIDSLIETMASRELFVVDRTASYKTIDTSKLSGYGSADVEFPLALNDEQRPLDDPMPGLAVKTYVLQERQVNGRTNSSITLANRADHGSRIAVTIHLRGESYPASVFKALDEIRYAILGVYR